MDIVLSSSSHHAMLFAYVAKEVVDQFGTEGSEAIISAVTRYGRQRGRRMAMRSKIDGNPCDALGYDMYGEWACFPGQVERRIYEEAGHFQVCYDRCPWYTEWKHCDMLPYGRYYCSYVDAAILEGFGVTDGGLTSCRPYGSTSCDLNFTGEGYRKETYQRRAVQRYLLGDRAQMPWKYHVGHLYQCLLRSVEEHFGQEGLRAVRRAMKNYRAQFGEAAARLVLEYAERDYEELPPYESYHNCGHPLEKADRLLETDVVVVGGSGAAVTAAVAAAEQGHRVTMVCKGRIANSGNLLMAGGGFGIDSYSARHKLGIAEANDNWTKRDLLDALLKEGFYLNDQDLAELYVEEGPEAVQQFLQWAADAGEKYRFLPSGTWVASGKSFARALAQGMAGHPEIERMEDCVVTDVLTDSGRVQGVVAQDLYRGEILVIRAKAVILATGGFQPFSRSNTVTDVTGDGQAIACRAGAELVDMEFLLGMPTAMEPADLRGSIYPFVFEFNLPELRYRLLDRDFRPLEIPAEVTERFRGKKISKLINSWCFAWAKAHGRLTDRGGLYIDYSETPLPVRKASLEQFHEQFSLWHKRGWFNGNNLEAVEQAILDGRPLEIMLGYEYAMGGIQVDQNMATSVMGLYAAGEVTGGTFGACRAGDGIVEMLVQGRRAGQSAAEFCAARGLQPLSVAPLQQALDRMLRYLRPGAPERSPLQLLEEIHDVCDREFGVLRCESGLQNALERLKQLRQWLQEDCGVQDTQRVYNMEWLRALECENLLLCCEAGIRAALERRESRGCHMRSDYPQVDHDDGIIKYVFHLENGNLVMSRRKPRKTRTALPAGKKPSVLEYLTDPKLDYRR